MATAETQKSLLDDQEPNQLDTMLAEHETAQSAPSTELVPSSSTDVVPGPLADLRDHAMQMTPDDIRQAMTVWTDRRTAFREVILEQMEEGLHYGFPPGCEPKYNADGTALLSQKGNEVPEKQWRAKRSLYEAGADFMCDLMGLRVVFEIDVKAWEIAGRTEFQSFKTCTLFSRHNGAVVGEGCGAAKAADHQGSIHTMNHMACKRAKVAAVVTAYALSDLFEVAEGDAWRGPANHPAPVANKDAPKDQPRAKRVTAAQLKSLAEAYKAVNPNADRATYLLWVSQVCEPRDFDANKQNQWTIIDLGKCSKELGLPQ